MRALEVFGADGGRLTRYYAPRVQALEVWELDPAHESSLRERLPGATIRITDSYAEIQREHDPFDLVVVDNFVSPREHFDLCPHLFRLLADEPVLVLRVVPGAGAATVRQHPHVFSREHLERRREFYRTPSPAAIPRPKLYARYAELAREHGFEPEWHFFEGRRELQGLVPRQTGFHCFLVLKLTRADG
jgi:hypothetical protein